MARYRPVRRAASAWLLSGGFKCLSVLKCWEPLLSCVPHWPRFQLFSAWDNRRNGFITKHNTWVLFNTIVVKVLIVVWFCAEHCVFSLYNLLKQPASDKLEHHNISVRDGSEDVCPFAWISAERRVQSTDSSVIKVELKMFPHLNFGKEVHVDFF